jgi:hypothetical protein
MSTLLAVHHHLALTYSGIESAGCRRKSNPGSGLTSCFFVRNVDPFVIGDWGGWYDETASQARSTGGKINASAFKANRKSGNCGVATGVLTIHTHFQSIRQDSTHWTFELLHIDLVMTSWTCNQTTLVICCSFTPLFKEDYFSRLPFARCSKQFFNEDLWLSNAQDG